MIPIKDVHIRTVSVLAVFLLLTHFCEGSLHTYINNFLVTGLVLWHTKNKAPVMLFWVSLLSAHLQLASFIHKLNLNSCIYNNCKFRSTVISLHCFLDYKYNIICNSFNSVMQTQKYVRWGCQWWDPTGRTV